VRRRSVSSGREGRRTRRFGGGGCREQEEDEEEDEVGDWERFLDTAVVGEVGGVGFVTWVESDVCCWIKKRQLSNIIPTYANKKRDINTYLPPDITIRVTLHETLLFHFLPKFTHPSI